MDFVSLVFLFRHSLYHPAHLVGSSPYPVALASVVYFLITTLLIYFKYGNLFYMSWGLLALFFVLALWIKDICLEALSGSHNTIVQSGLNTAFILFLFSELMFFVSIFWVYFDASLCPAVELGGVWPPFGMPTLNYLGLPLLGTTLLLSSGVTVTWSHSQLLSNTRASNTLLMTILLAAMFLIIQFWEYQNSPLSISDGIYGSLFYFSTGFHGFHVMLGALLLSLSLVRLNLIHITSLHHLGFETSILYWHFVDVVWLFLFLFVYIWGS